MRRVLCASLKKRKKTKKKADRERERGTGPAEKTEKHDIKEVWGPRTEDDE